MGTLPLQSRFAREMEGFHVPWPGAQVPAPRLIRYNSSLSDALGLPHDFANAPEAAAILAGAQAVEGTTPLAMVYAGHQFGQFSPRLGDGRALLLGEIETPSGPVELHLKGSGRTPFSRGGDGKAVLGPVLREYLISEAMHALGIPSTRALAAVITGEAILRNGPEPGAVLARVASSHLRVGTFQYFAARGETDKLTRLVDFAVQRHDPDLAGRRDRALGLLERVVARQARLIAQWMSVGFVHGVMNTDNMTISGETIDFGPCAFLDRYDPGTVFSSIDRQGRYAYANQPRIALWNLARFAESLLPLISPDDPEQAVAPATAVLDGFGARYDAAWLEIFGAKIGLANPSEADRALIVDLLALMEAQALDFTGTFRALSGDNPPLAGDEGAAWLARWRERLAGETRPSDAIRAAMDAVNPLYIPRNHLVEAALAAAKAGDMAPFEALLARISAPFAAHPGAGRYAEPAPGDFGPYQTFCGT